MTKINKTPLQTFFTSPMDLGKKLPSKILALSLSIIVGIFTLGAVHLGYWYKNRDITKKAGNDLSYTEKTTGETFDKTIQQKSSGNQAKSSVKPVEVAINQAEFPVNQAIDYVYSGKYHSDVQDFFDKNLKEKLPSGNYFILAGPTGHFHTETNAEKLKSFYDKHKDLKILYLLQGEFPKQQKLTLKTSSGNEETDMGFAKHFQKPVEFEAYILATPIAGLPQNPEIVKKCNGYNAEMIALMKKDQIVD